MSADGLFRFASIAMRRYSREPGSRVHSARALLTAAINLYAAETSAGEAALTAAEALGELAQRERRTNSAREVKA